MGFSDEKLNLSPAHDKKEKPSTATYREVINTLLNNLLNFLIMLEANRCVNFIFYFRMIIQMLLLVKKRYKKL